MSFASPIPSIDAIEDTLFPSEFSYIYEYPKKDIKSKKGKKIKGVGGSKWYAKAKKGKGKSTKTSSYGSRRLYLGGGLSALHDMNAI